MSAIPLSSSLQPPRADLPAADIVPLHDRTPVHPAPAAHDALAVLVGAAASLDLRDTEAVARLRVAAHGVTARIAAIGRLPAHLVVQPDDADVVVVRTLAVVGRRLGWPPAADTNPGSRRGPGETARRRSTGRRRRRWSPRWWSTPPTVEAAGGGLSADQLVAALGQRQVAMSILEQRPGGRPPSGS